MPNDRLLNAFFAASKLVLVVVLLLVEFHYTASNNAIAIASVLVLAGLLGADRLALGFYKDIKNRINIEFLVFFVSAVIGLYLMSFVAIDKDHKYIIALYLSLFLSTEISDFLYKEVSVPISCILLCLSSYIFLDSNNAVQGPAGQMLVAGLCLLFVVSAYTRLMPIGDILIISSAMIFIASTDFFAPFLLFSIGVFFCVVLIALFSKRKEVPFIPVISIPLLMSLTQFL